MATIPNRYYNSPWIRDAAANLSDAMFGSPERDMQRLQAKNMEAQMQRQAQQDQLEAAERERMAADRAKDEVARQRLAMFESHPYSTEDSDEEINRKRTGILLDSSMPLSQVLAYQQKPELQGQKLDANMRALQARLDAQGGQFNDRLGYLYTALGQAMNLGTMRDATTRRGQDIGSADRRYGADVGAYSRAQAARPINRRDEFLVSAEIEQFAEDRNYQLTPTQKSEIQALALQNRVPVIEAWNEVMKDAQISPGEPTGWFGLGGAGPSTVTTVPNLSRVVTTSPSLPPQAIAQLKEGEETDFANGSTWTLRNGQPVQVR